MSGTSAGGFSNGVEIRGPRVERQEEVLPEEAIAFVVQLQRRFEPRRQALLARRAERQAAFAAGTLPDFLPETAHVRQASWQVDPVPADLHDRKVEITGPTDRKMMINALNSGASVYMADFEDANTPTWDNMVAGQANLIDAVDGTIAYQAEDGRAYRLGDRVATLLVRPRGWHLEEKHFWVDGRPASASLLDFGLYFFHCAQRRMKGGSGLYLYLPKLESHLEARLWNDVFVFSEDLLGVPRGTVKATVLVETILAAFEMDEILYELREHSGGLNAGRWDYIFSLIKKFHHRSDFLLPDRAQVTMAVPFMRAYTQLLVKTCHRRGAFAVGGMAAYIPSRRDPVVNELALSKVREDKEREAGDGFDGTWVAHPDLVPTALEVFQRFLGSQQNQLQRQRDDVSVAAGQLLDVRIPGSAVTETGLRNNVSVGIQYLESWLRGVGCAAINNLMEDAATAEIARSQIWQWVHHGARMDDGRAVTAELVRRIEAEEMERLRETLGAAAVQRPSFAAALRLFEEVTLREQFTEFLTVPAYAEID